KPGTGLREPVHTDDLALAILACMSNPATYGKIYNLGGGERLPYRDMVTRIAATLGLARALLVPGLPLLLDALSLCTRRAETSGEIARRMNNDLIFDGDAARTDFGYDPRTFLSGGKRDLGVTA